MVPKRLLGVASLLAGCMMIDNISPQARFSDQVHELNDELRWGRIDLAVQRVAAAHRATFLRRHRAWSREVQIADVDVTNLEMSLPDGTSASTVTYAWVDTRTMQLRTTSVRQRWVGAGDGFVLANEEIVGGEPSLLPGAPLAMRDGDGAGGEDERWERVAPVEGADTGRGAEAGEPAPLARAGASQPSAAAPVASARRRDPQGVPIP